MFFRFTLLIAISLVCIQPLAGQDIALTIDSSQSNVNMSVSGASDSSALSGTASIELLPASEPFSTAQIKTMDVVLDDGFTLSIFGGLVSASTQPGDSSMSLVTPGAAGTVDGLNQFDQLINEAAFAGIVSVNDPFNLAGGTRDIDLGTLGTSLFDMTDVQLSVNGTTLTVAATFNIVVPLDVGLDLIVDGSIVSTGELPEPDIQVVPDSLNIIRGVLASGTSADLAESDNVDVSVRRDPAAIQSVTDIEIKGISSNDTPGAMEFTLEASVFARTAVTQVISLYDYDADDWELVDSRPAQRFSDLVTTVSLGGDVSRFVQPGTGCVEAKIIFQSANPRQQFTANIDQTIWTIGN